MVPNLFASFKWNILFFVDNFGLGWFKKLESLQRNDRTWRYWNVLILLLSSGVNFGQTGLLGWFWSLEWSTG